MTLLGYPAFTSYGHNYWDCLVASRKNFEVCTFLIKLNLMNKSLCLGNVKVLFDMILTAFIYFMASSLCWRTVCGIIRSNRLKKIDDFMMMIV